METVAFHFTQLYQRLIQDFDRWSVTGDDLAETVETFDKQVQKFATLDEKVTQQLNDSIEEGTQRVTATLLESFRKATKTMLAEEIKGSADTLFKTVQQTERTLESYQRQIISMRKWDILLNFVSALLGGLTSGIILYYLFS